MTDKEIEGHIHKMLTEKDPRMCEQWYFCVNDVGSNQMMCYKCGGLASHQQYDIAMDNLRRENDGRQY